jgi:phage tail-like protein
LSAAINNLDYLYGHLPARMVRDDEGLFLKRFLHPVGVELDGFDLKLDTFFEKIDPATAPRKFIDWGLYAFFGWSWFPEWFTLDRRRAFYAAIALHYAERGTLAGIKNFLNAFGLRVIVEGGPRFRGENAMGERVWTCPSPLVIIVRLFSQAPAVNEDLCFHGEATHGEDFPATPSKSIQLADVDKLLRFVWPLSQHIFIEGLPLRPRTLPAVPVGYGDGEYGVTLPG